MMCYYIEAVVRHQQHPGVAKFGIALEWGSRGLEFDSRLSDQKKILSNFRQDFSFVLFILHYSTFIIHFGTGFS